MTAILFQEDCLAQDIQETTNFLAQKLSGLDLCAFLFEAVRCTDSCRRIWSQLCHWTKERPKQPRNLKQSVRKSAWSSTRTATRRMIAILNLKTHLRKQARVESALRKIYFSLLPRCLNYSNSPVEKAPPRSSQETGRRR